jgi:hypothetical protein
MMPADFLALAWVVAGREPGSGAGIAGWAAAAEPIRPGRIDVAAALVRQVDRLNEAIGRVVSWFCPT